jgi:cysteine desulfurase
MNNNEKRTVYLDNSATTPLSAAAREAVTEAMECFGNPSSLHTLGTDAERLVTQSRERIMSALGVRRGQGTVIFTSCGTEATSLAIFGTAYAKTRREASRILTTDSEHPATARALEALEKQQREKEKTKKK